jgi:PRELI-like family
MTYSNVLTCHETVVYEPHAQEPLSRTAFSQKAEITALCGGWQKIKSSLEEYSVMKFGENAKKGREGFEAVLEMSRRVFGEERERIQAERMAMA